MFDASVLPLDGINHEPIIYLYKQEWVFGIRSIQCPGIRFFFFLTQSSRVTQVGRAHIGLLVIPVGPPLRQSCTPCCVSDKTGLGVIGRGLFSAVWTFPHFSVPL